MSIGSTIKKLRRDLDITQEQLAEYLGITSRAVSQWECDRTAPDISQLPLLANIFEVSADVLLGIDVTAKQKKIDDIYNTAYETASSGDHKKSIEMWLDGLKQFPDSYKLMGEYVDEIYCYSHMLDDKEEQEKRALEYIDRIIADCTESSVRNEAILTACMWYPRLGRTAEAERMVKSLPNTSSIEMYPRIYTGTKKYEALRTCIIGKFTDAVGELTDFAKSRDDDGSDIFNDDGKLCLCRKQVELFKIFFENGDFVFHAQYLEIPYRRMSYIYAKRQDIENLLTAADAAADYAVMFDTYDQTATQTSLVARGNIPGGVWWHDTHNRSYDLLDWFENDEIFAFVRSNEHFIKTLDKLKRIAK